MAPPHTAPSSHGTSAYGAFLTWRLPQRAPSSHGTFLTWHLPHTAPSSYGTFLTRQAADAIIHQPGVRQMLLFQKAIAEGGRSMLYECSQIADHMQVCAVAGDAKGEKKHDDRLGFLTPILKGFLTEAGKEAADLGIQARLIA